ncbi:MAG: hypothetical protein WAX66_01610 [Patescibacteria group bacterium]
MATDQQVFNLGMLTAVLSSSERVKVTGINPGNGEPSDSMSLTLLDTKNGDTYKLEITDIKIKKEKEALEERILRALKSSGPKTFDAITEELKVTDEELTKALDKLKSSGYIESIEANDFCWSLVPIH